MVDILSLLLPIRCVACGAAEARLCRSCASGLAFISRPVCERCGKPTATGVSRCGECRGRRLAFSRARAAVLYEGAAVALVAAWKERGQRSLVREAAAIVAAGVDRPDVDAIAPVPPSADRLLWRGHDPAGALAAQLARTWGYEVATLLSRPPGHRRQRGLSRRARRSNVAGAFLTRSASPPRVCLVDDVYTSGATVAACAAALRQAGCRHVEVITFARTPRDGLGSASSRPVR